MDDSIKSLIHSAKEHMEKSLNHFESELSKIRAGKAHPSILEGVKAEFYGMPMPLNQLGSISAVDARTLTIQPFDKKAISAIERGIMEANLGLNPSNDGIVIRIPVPALNEQRRKDLVKQAKGESETAKIAIRNIRQDTNAKLKKLTSVGEDMVKDGEKKVQDITNDYVAKVDKHLKVKEEEIMQV